MQFITVGSKNQVVLPLEIRKKIKGLKPGKKVMVYPLNEDTIAIRVEQENWLERTAGIASKTWNKIDTTRYLDKLRNEWDEK